MLKPGRRDLYSCSLTVPQTALYPCRAHTPNVIENAIGPVQACCCKLFIEYAKLISHSLLLQ